MDGTLQRCRLGQQICMRGLHAEGLKSLLQVSGSSTGWTLGQQQEGSTTVSSQQDHGDPFLKGKSCDAKYWLCPAETAEQSALM